MTGDRTESQVKTVNSHNAKSNAETKVGSVQGESDQDDVRVIGSNLTEADELSISDDLDAGGDPYNSTGQHVVLKIKQEYPD